MGKLQDGLVREQVRHGVAPFSPFWKNRLRELGITAASVEGVTSLGAIPAVGERDVSPDGDPAAMAALVLQAGDRGYALHAPGPDLRRALRKRATSKDDYRRHVARDTRPTSYVWSGLGFRYPLASTRSDLDVVARAGARLWKVLGLTADDALLSTLPVASTTEHVALSLAATGAGAPALFPGSGRRDVVAAARLANPTVLAVASGVAAEVLGWLGETDALERVHTVLLVGAPTDRERDDARAVLRRRGVAVLGVHAPAGARVLWAECRESGADGGLHTYPDLDVVQVVDAETGEPAEQDGEVVLTQLGLRGSALLRWRTGDVVSGPVDTEPCPGCGRRVPRLHGLRRGVLVLTSDDGRALDLRSLAGALAGRDDLTDWRVVIGPRRRDGRGQVVVHLEPKGEPAQAAVAAAADVRTLAGVLPTQLVAAAAADLAGLDGERLTRRVLRRD